MIKFKGSVVKAAVVVLAAIVTDAAAAQDNPAANFPNRPIRLIVGFAAGGGNDLFARLVGQKLSENVGQPVVIENKPGAGGRIAVEYVKNQPADGYTVMVAASGQMAIAAAIYPKLSYHPTRDFLPLTMIASFPLILAGPSGDTIKSVKELIAYGKANPDKSNYATSSPAFTITTELFKLKTGMPAVAVPYKSSNEMMLSVAGGNTLFAIADGPPTMPLVQGAKIRALAVTGSERSSELPDVPSMAEAGYPEVNIGLWSGLFVLASTPPAIANKLGTELRRAMADSGVRDKLKAMAVNPGGGPGEEFRKKIDADIDVFADVVKAANLKFEE
ncbi:MAG: tripartite tricarboxylate transporter substrate binding protein [Alphaproteobacteria bacterium]|nr:MAG: tripartite tricarboxylate transporter substrate binding protein [Alphaproteobacteria bacterium]